MLYEVITRCALLSGLELLLDGLLLVITSYSIHYTKLYDQDAFQECDTVGITRPCVKHNFLVKDVKDLAATIKKAFYLAQTGRPGPVLVDVPKDVTAMVTEYQYPESVSMRSYNPVRKGHAGQIKKAARLIRQAKRPMVYTGGGVILSNAAPRLTEFVRP